MFDLSTQHRTASFAAITATDAYPIMVRPIAIHIVVTVVLWLWVRSATQVIARADRAEVIATLEHAIAQQEHADAQLKRQLEMSIQQIVETRQRLANGDFNARAPLNNGNVLWQIAGSLNNLLSRFQRLRPCLHLDAQCCKRLTPFLAYIFVPLFLIGLTHLASKMLARIGLSLYALKVILRSIPCVRLASLLALTSRP